MGQVPQMLSYLIIGGGRVARHMAHYLQLESIPYATWKRQDGETALRTQIAACSHILLLISDRSISSFVHENPFLSEKPCVHFSGSVVNENIPSAHPLMTFSESLYELETYRGIPFITEAGRPDFHQLLPGLSNPSFAIESQKKTLYHALCVLSGNFSTLLWEKVFRDFEEKLGLPSSVTKPYLQQVLQNLLQTPVGTSVLTGPLVRGDRETIQRHLHVLNGDPYANVYRAFVEAYQSENQL